MKNKKYHTVVKFTKSDRKIVESGKIDTTWPLTFPTWCRHFIKRMWS